MAAGEHGARDRRLSGSFWTEALIAVVTLAVLLLAVFAFLLVATVGFNTSGGFVAVVQSSVSASGVAGQLMQKPRVKSSRKWREELKGP